jgi:hypothetical protein
MVSFCSFALERIMMKKTATPPPLQDYFTDVPPKYDLINRVMTWGFDQRYRKRMAKMIASSGVTSFLDIGTGTGDLVHQVGFQCNDAGEGGRENRDAGSLAGELSSGRCFSDAF